MQICSVKSQANVTGSQEKGCYFSRQRPGSQEVSGAMVTAAQAVGQTHGEIIREPSDARLIRDFESKGERSRSQTANCDCEPVWGTRNPAVKDDFNQPPDRSGVATGTGKKGIHPAK